MRLLLTLTVIVAVTLFLVADDANAQRRRRGRRSFRRGPSRRPSRGPVPSWLLPFLNQNSNGINQQALNNFLSNLVSGMNCGGGGSSGSGNGDNAGDAGDGSAGNVDGTTDGATDGTTGDNANGTDGSNDGTDGNNDGATDGTSGTNGGTTTGGATDGTAGSTTDGTADGQTGGTDGTTADGTTDGTGDGTAADGSTGGATDGTTGSATDGTADGTTGDDASTVTPPDPQACCTVISSGITEAEKEAILKRHNDLRARVAAGDEPGQPAATNLGPLEWDDNLANFAQSYVNECVTGHSTNEERSQITGFNSAGENIATRMSTVQISSAPEEAANMVQSWYNEVKDWPADRVGNYQPTEPNNGPQTGHYTQVVWAETTKVGCGIIQYRCDSEDFPYTKRLICNYGEAGNILGQPVYETN